MHRPLLLLPLLAALAPAAGPADAPLPSDKAPLAMKLPEGFRGSLVASEPQLIKPIAMTLDERGRLWVVESHSYPHWIRDGKEGNDRILIFEDKEGKGRYDCTVFWDKGTNLSGIAVGFGGVWLCATPNLVFIPVKPGEDKPAGPPRVVLDGWSLDAKHNVFSSLTWGPDGWLYGCNGITATSHVGTPATARKDRTPMNCGVWRWHPSKERFEVVAWGTTNPWGLDFDERGEMFITNCVIKHIFHVVPGAHFVRMYGEDLNPHCYGLIESCADHIHWAGGAWGESRSGQAHSDAGGGHAHVGAMVYLGDNWPADYRNHVFMCNIHGNRVNQDLLEPRGSGYVVRHAPDFLMANDPWFRGINLMYGPDGGVFVADWCDTGECHNYDKVQPRGRVYRVTYGQPKRVTVDLAKLSDEELVKLQLHKNDWWVRQSRRLLQERATAGMRTDLRPALQKMFDAQTEVPQKLRALWALYSIGGTDEKFLIGLLNSKDAALCSWAIRLLVNDRKISDPAASCLAGLAGRATEVASVRLALASALQRLPAEQAWPIAEQLASHAEDGGDPYLPHMLWYGIEGIVPADPERALALASKSRMALVRQYIARRLAETGNGKTLDLVVQALSADQDADRHLDVLRGMHAALRGQRDLKPPTGWTAARDRLVKSEQGEARQKALMLSVIFGDQEALTQLRTTASGASAAEAERRSALQTLIEVRAPELVPLLQKLVADPKLRGQALRGLASFNDPATPDIILKQYASFSDADKTDAVTTLASRPDYAMALLDAIGKGQVPPRDLSAFTARQILGLKNPKLSARLNEVWGSIRPTAGDKAALLSKYKTMVPPGALAKADRSQGRALFAKTCAQCHLLFGEGGKIGPDLTGSQRANPEYLLTKLLDPNAVVAKDYQVSVIGTTSGRVITGIVTKEDDKTVTVQTQNELLTLAKSEIDERKKTGQSMMPEGQLAMLSEKEVRDLIAYLAGAEQVPLPK
jgi:putative membrane-bound dehydrogenase-like protein